MVEMTQKMVQIKKNKRLSKATSDIIEARKNPKFKKFIKEFIKHHTN